jgi:hypothetical protein
MFLMFAKLLVFFVAQNVHNQICTFSREREVDVTNTCEV